MEREQKPVFQENEKELKLKRFHRLLEIGQTNEDPGVSFLAKTKALDQLIHFSVISSWTAIDMNEGRWPETGDVIELSEENLKRYPLLTKFKQEKSEAELQKEWREFFRIKSSLINTGFTDEEAKEAINISIGFLAREFAPEESKRQQWVKDMSEVLQWDTQKTTILFNLVTRHN